MSGSSFSSRREASPGCLRLRESAVAAVFRSRYPAYSVPFKIQTVLADDQVSLVNHLRSDVDPVAQVKIDEIGRSIFHFVKRGLFLCAGADIGEFVVVIDLCDRERLLIALEPVI